MLAVANTPAELALVERLLERVESGDGVVVVEASRLNQTIGGETPPLHPSGRFKGHVATTQKELETILKELIGVGAERQIRVWLADGMPGKPGHYEVDAVVEWCMKNDHFVKKIGAIGNGDLEEIDKGHWSAFRVREQALQEQMDRQEREYELLPRAAVELQFATLLTSLGDWCDQLPDKVGTIVPKQYAAKVRERLRTDLTQRRQQVHDELTRVAADWDRKAQKVIERARS